jgi:hypothetical protein
MEYHPPVDRLLSYGSAIGQPDWPNYLALGVSAEHVPELIRMALDDALHVSDRGTEMWAPVHAMRALGQLRAAAAAEPLSALLRRIDELEDEWVGEQLPVVYGMIGEAAIPVLSAYLADSAHGLRARNTAAQSLEEIARQQPETRETCVAALSRQLERFVENNVGLNASIVANLVELKAVESADVIEQAFAFDRVDMMVLGDWEDVQVKLGLKEGRERPHTPLEWDQLLVETAPKAAAASPPLRWGTAPVSKDKEKARAKRKQAKQSRRKNRKR